MMPKTNKTTENRCLSKFVLAGLDPRTDEPQLVRQVRVLNGLMLTAMALCIPLGTFWVFMVSPNFAFAYGSAFCAWLGLVCWLQHSHQVTWIGRAAVTVLFALCTVSVLLLGGTESNLLAWYILMPLAAAVCIGQRDLWFWGVVATIAPILFYLFPNWSLVSPSPFTVEINRQLSGIALALGALIASILTSVWISHHERLAQRLDASAVRLRKEADAQRVLATSTIHASGELSLAGGARALLQHLDTLDWVSAVAFWDSQHSIDPPSPQFRSPSATAFNTTQSLTEAMREGERTTFHNPSSDHQHVYYPVKDGQRVVGVIEIDIGTSHDTSDQNSWLLQQIAIQLGHIAERERTAKIIEREARFDSLTSLGNRRAFHRALENEIAHTTEEDSSTALLFIDLNDFKRINDSLGHEAGDTVLKVVAQRLQLAVRQDDKTAKQWNRSADTIFRVGGDEFTLVLNDINSANDADRAAQRILEVLSAPIQVNEQLFKVGASIGIAIYPEDAQQPDALIRSADSAMYAAKRRGGSGYSRYRDADRGIDSLRFEGQLRRALVADQLEMLYQPIFCCASGKPVGAEALIRWNHPDQGSIPPTEFVPLAEATGLISELGEFQFESVLCWFESAQAELPADFRIALNLSPNQISDPEFSAWLLRRLNETSIPMRKIELELTETALLADTPDVETNVRALADLGICITLDDFGTGQSSLSLLKRFPIGRIKIDQSFVGGLPSRSEDVAIVGAVISLARELDIPVVAEGVEDAAQEQFLADRHCAEMQGFLLARPMGGKELVRELGEPLQVHQTRAS